MRTCLDQIVNAVLYEGCILHPCHASSKRNPRGRFTCGRVYPQLYSRGRDDAEPCLMQMECLFRSRSEPFGLNVTLGFLQLIKREIGVLERPVSRLPQNGHLKFQTVPQLDVGGKTFQGWTEAVERKISARLENTGSLEVPFTFPAGQEREPVYNETGDVAALFQRTFERLEGRIAIRVLRLEAGRFKITVHALNLSPVEPCDRAVPERVLQQTFASTHITLEAETGEFISLLETPQEFKAFADDCRNIGCWPVLVGNERRHECRSILASPIILDDYPKIAPESTTRLFHGTGIDERSALHPMTLRDQETCAADTDVFSRRSPERAGESRPGNVLKLPGVIKKIDFPNAAFLYPSRPVEAVWTRGAELKPGDLVIICPKRRADAIDLMLAGKTAVIEAIEQDAREQIHLALVLTDDPGFDFGLARQSGHRFFYGIDEVKPLKKEVHA